MRGSVSDIDIRLLRVFMTVVRCGGFAASQSALNVSQANISMQMKQLEQRLGVTLCHRGRSGFWLTEEGKQVFEACQTLFRSLDEFRSSVAASSGRLSGRLHISVVDNSVFNEDFHLNEAIRDFKDQGNNSEVVLYVVATNEVEQMVLDGSCDMGIGFFPARRQGLEYYPLFSSGMNLYCGRQHPLFKRAPDQIDLEEVFMEEHAARGYVSTTQLPSFERKFLVGASASTVEGLVTFILSGKYTAYLPYHYARHWADKDEIRPILPDKIGYNCLYEFTTRSANKRSQLLDLFVEKLTAVHAQIDDKKFQIGTDIRT
ncbi:LysR family transcriptional regulator [uncultured Ruegeria sp.]|uniref:LysR family transcriptional regulator n=1 Tax=uncultured Ruegeria sp. TaxID=259304 RepID=UPI00262FE3D4|nr:LysR family transcriptional regulator [uncultured Ruegeria sp.]